jgi:hypothetical protein
VVSFTCKTLVKIKEMPVIIGALLGIVFDENRPTCLRSFQIIFSEDQMTLKSSFIIQIALIILSTSNK